MATPIEEPVFEARVGGHIYDRGADGTVCRWARLPDAWCGYVKSH